MVVNWSEMLNSNGERPDGPCYFLAMRILKLYASVILQISIKVNVRCIICIISALGWLGWEGLLAMSLKEKPPLGFIYFFTFDWVM